MHVRAIGIALLVALTVPPLWFENNIFALGSGSQEGQHLPQEAAPESFGP